MRRRAGKMDKDIQGKNAPARGSCSPSPCPCRARRTSCCRSPRASSPRSRRGSRRRRCGSTAAADSAPRSSCGSHSRRRCGRRRCCLAAAPAGSAGRVSRRPGWGHLGRTFFSRDFSAFSSFCAFFACRLSVFAVNWADVSGWIAVGWHGADLQLEQGLCGSWHQFRCAINRDWTYSRDCS